MAGANVIMPNITPPGARERYAIYDNKLNRNNDSGEQLAALLRATEEAGFVPRINARGDSKVQVSAG